MATWQAIGVGAVAMALFIAWSFACYATGKQEGIKEEKERQKGG